jgi:hypothetical protein
LADVPLVVLGNVATDTATAHSAQELQNGETQSRDSSINPFFRDKFEPEALIGLTMINRENPIRLATLIKRRKQLTVCEGTLWPKV